MLPSEQEALDVDSLVTALSLWLPYTWKDGLYIK